MISHALDNKVSNLNVKLKSIVPDLKELVKLGVLMNRHSKGILVILTLRWIRKG